MSVFRTMSAGQAMHPVIVANESRLLILAHHQGLLYQQHFVLQLLRLRFVMALVFFAFIFDRSARVLHGITGMLLLQTSWTYLTTLESGKSSITFAKLEQLSERLDLSPLTLLALTVGEEAGEPAAALANKLGVELREMTHGGGLPGLKASLPAPEVNQLRHEC